MNRPPVTDHALVRYIERVIDFDLTDVKMECAKRFKTNPTDAHIIAFIAYKTGANIAAMKKAILDIVFPVLGGVLSDGTYKIGDCIYVIADNCIVTVYRNEDLCEVTQ